MNRPLQSLMQALNLKPDSADSLRQVAEAAEVDHSLVRYWQSSFLIPPDKTLAKICQRFHAKPLVVKLRMGFIDEEVRRFLAEKAESIGELGGLDTKGVTWPFPAEPVFNSKFGTLYRGDCLQFMEQIPNGTFDLIFADPPFNLDKKYPSNINDALKAEDYLIWCFSWIDECVRLLAEGGSLFVYNLPKWNTAIAEYLNGKLTFRDWIAIDVKFSLPIPKRLYPSHYSLLYYTKADKPKTFKPDRMPMQICPHCLRDLKDYGGYKDKMNPIGVNLTDVWNDIPPVRHKRFKKRQGANELSIKLLDRVIEMSSAEGDHIFDPFGGSGSTYVVSEIKRRRWTGIEIGPVREIIHRLENLDGEADYLFKFRQNYNCLFVPKNKAQRHRLGLWTDETVNGKSKTHNLQTSLVLE